MKVAAASCSSRARSASRAASSASPSPPLVPAALSFAHRGRREGEQRRENERRFVDENIRD